jgi:GH24 family phage-related lysozyme (muramidase)
MANFTVLSGGRQTGPGDFTMTTKQPMIVELQYAYNSDSKPFEVRCNDFNNPHGVVATEPVNGASSPTSLRFKLAAKRRDRVMLEARLPASSGSWWDWPLYASVQIAVAFDSPADAQSRSENYSAQIIPNPAPGCPRGIRDDVWSSLLNFTKQHEGCTDFMYNDRGNPQRVTCGIGLMFKTADDAIGYKDHFVDPDGQKPSEDDITHDFDAAHRLRRTDRNLWEFAAVTLLRMPWDDVTELLGSVMAKMVGTMLSMPTFSNFARFPRDAQVACASISYGGWAYSCFDPLKEAIRAQDWARAADVYQSPGWDPRKDQGHQALFRRAARGT